MYYYNGSIGIKGTEEQANEVLEFLRMRDDRFFEKKLWHSTKDSVYEIDATMDGVDLEGTLNELVDYSKYEKLDVIIDVRFTGVDTGGYYYRNCSGKEKLEYFDENDLTLREVSDEQLLSEVRRRHLDSEIYDKVHLSYLIDDAARQLDDYYGCHKDYSEDFLSMLADKFMNRHDCNLDDNSQWVNIIKITDTSENAQ